ncbi:hypothetical protein CRI94_02270 [Longibacter salinarum]|uniref:Uncharacterized protein n=1 Tax=Longibacter salinarum TaxID=1850348 RepID=A0A2A8D2W1_9BACT|nr:hypothetical protein [Longibacter salinarum]PEN15133.1 hypothetical protein CRI94_02270 [Longibacter salinarum]
MNTLSQRTTIASIDDLRELLLSASKICVSFYASTALLPEALNLIESHRPTIDGSRTKRVERHIDQAIERLHVDLQPLADGTTFSEVEHQGIGIFAHPERSWYLPLPMPISTHVAVGEGVCLGPLLHLFDSTYIVALRLEPHGATLLRRYGDWTSTMPLEVNVDPPAVSANAPTMASMRPLIQWLTAVDQALGAFLPRSHHPVALIAPPELRDAYMSLNLHRTLMPLPPPKGAENASHDSALDMATEAAVHRAEKQSIDDLRVLETTRAHAPDRYSDDPYVIATEAASRRVETLFVRTTYAEQHEHWEPQTGNGSPTTTPHVGTMTRPKCGSRVEQTMAQTLLAGGTVHNVQDTGLLSGKPMAAVFRY